MNKPRFIYLVFQRGIVDYIGCSLKEAQNMSEPPDSSIDPNIFMIHRWKLVKNKYEFDRRVKKKGDIDEQAIKRKRR